MKTTLLAAAGLIAGAAALPSDTHTVHQRRNLALDPRFERRAAVDADAKIPFEIALKQGNVQDAEAKLYDISNPKSANYGKHLSKDEVVKMFAADDKDIDSVKQWLAGQGIADKDIHVNPTKTWIKVSNTTAGVVERALKTRYHVYRSTASGEDHIGAEEYSLPNNLVDIVDFVRPGPAMAKVTVRATGPAKGDQAIGEPVRKLSDDDMKRVQDAIKAGPSATGKAHDAADNSTLPEYLKICGMAVTPDCIAYLYKIPKAEGTNSTNRLGIYESLGDVYSQEDLDLFFKTAAPYIPAGTGPELDLINGATAPNSPSQAGGESLLDFDMAYPIIYPQGTTLFQVATDQYYNIFGDFLTAIDSDYCSQDPFWNNHKMCGTFEPTNVVSISYGGPEDATDPKGAHRQCNEFMKLGLMGVTVVVASGDAGVSDRNGYCLGPHHDIFVADDLCSCPYITAVGSTVIHAIDEPETATESFSSGGGFSNIFTRPQWQEAAVSTYLLRHNPGYFAYNTSEGAIPTGADDRGIYNRGGRGFPDVAAVGDKGLVAVGGQLGLSGGTSMSAPIVAAILNRINEKRLGLGKGPIGFANPALYAMSARSFNDVTVGDQSLGGADSDRGNSACGNKGFSAVEGWDPVTGLGTPIYGQWENYFLEL